MYFATLPSLSIVLAVTSALTLETRASKNLIKNGGFESETIVPWRPEDDGRPELTLELIRPGIASRTSFRVTMRQPTDTTEPVEVFKLDQDLALVKGKRYDFSCEFQFDNLAQPSELRFVYRDIHNMAHTISRIYPNASSTSFFLAGYRAPIASRQLELTFLNYLEAPSQTQLISVDNIKVVPAK